MFNYDNDPAHVNPTTITSPLGMPAGQRTLTYEPNTLKPTPLKDENGTFTNYAYADPLDRLTLVARGATSSFESHTSYSYPSTTQLSIKQDQTGTGNGDIRVDTLYDGFGRQIQTNQYETTSTYISTTTAYDALGRVQSTTNPTRPNDGLNDTIYYTTYTYDGLGRVKSVQPPDSATVTASYSGNQTTVTIPGGQPNATVNQTRRTVSDALGRVASVTEDPSGLQYLTTYTYNALNDLTNVSQGGGAQGRSFTYDTSGRLMAATNPENGTTTWAYDNNGNAIYREDARGVQTCYQYDTVNRLVQQVYYTGSSQSGTNCSLITNNTTTPSVTYTYDSPSITNANGRLASVSSINSAGQTVVLQQIGGYDALGRITGSSETVGGGSSFGFSYTYNFADSLLSENYPVSGRVVTNTYDAANRITNVTGIVGVVPNQQTTYYVSGVSGAGGLAQCGATGVNGVCYAPHGAPLSYVYGNGVTRTNTYNNRLQPQEITDAVGAAVSMDLQYLYGNATSLGQASALNNGNPTQITIARPGSTFIQNFQYDTVNRLSSFSDNGSGSTPQTFSYDPYGNVATTAPGTFPAQQMPSATSVYSSSTNRNTNLSYDAAGAGNVVVFGTSNLAWDAENRLATASNNTGNRAAGT